LSLARKAADLYNQRLSIRWVKAVEKFDVIIIGAGAAGMFCAAQAGQLGRRVLLLDNGKKAGRKILMSGGGRCNFTNLYPEPTASRITRKPLASCSAMIRRSRLLICC